MRCALPLHSAFAFCLCTLLLNFSFLHFSSCTPPFALLLLHFSSRVSPFCTSPNGFPAKKGRTLRLGFLQLGFLQVDCICFVFFRRKSLKLSCLWDRRGVCQSKVFDRPGPLFFMFFPTSFLDLIFLIFNGFWLPFGLHFLSFFIIFASPFRASILHRFFIDSGMDFSSFFHHLRCKLRSASEPREP